MPLQAPTTSSTRPYMVRAMYEWCVDNSCTPFIVVAVDSSVCVPQEFVHDGEIVLNVSLDATSSLKLGNDYIEFKARFGGVARDICIPLCRVSAIYGRENGQGMTFPVELSSNGDKVLRPASSPSVPVPMDTGFTPILGIVPSEESGKPTEPKAPSGPRPTLTRIK